MELINLSIGWLEKHDKFAAWAQAFAAVVALFLAIAVPVFQRWLEDRAERRRRRLEGEFIAVAIYSDILEMRARWQRVRGFAGRWPARADIAELLTHDAGVRRGLAEELRQARLDMPPTFEAEMPRFMLLGDKAGVALRQLGALIVQYNRMVDEGAKTVERRPVDLNTFGVSFRQHLDMIGPLLNDAETMVAQIMDRLVNRVAV